MYLVIF